MGIGGNLLSRILRTAGRPVDLSHYRNGVEDRPNQRDVKRQRILRPLRIGLDVSVWIAQRAHGNGAMLLDDKYLTDYGKGQSRGDEIPEERNTLLKAENCRAYIQLCADQVLTKILRLQDITHSELLVVLDGASPPIKKRECQKRRHRKLIAEQGRDSKDETKSVEKRARDARHAGAGALLADIIEELMNMLREHKIHFMVAPFEADGQLGYLAGSGEVDLVITEDSDLLCHDIPTILFKYDGEGKGILVQQKDLGAMEVRSNSLSLLDFCPTMIAIMFVCIGCDYCSSLDGIGPVAARDIVRDVFFTKDNNRPILRRILDKLYTKSRENLDAEKRKKYESEFVAALFAYLHPVIYSKTLQTYMLANNPPLGSDPILMKFQPYEALCTDVSRHEELLGSFPEPRLQKAIVEGWVSPRTLKPYSNSDLPQYLRDICDSNTTPNVNIVSSIQHEIMEPVGEIPPKTSPDISSSQVDINCESQDLQINVSNPYCEEKHRNHVLGDTNHSIPLQECVYETQEFDYHRGANFPGTTPKMHRPTADQGKTEPLPLVTRELLPTIEDCNSNLGQDAPELDVETQPTEPLPLVTRELFPTIEDYNSSLGHDSPGLDVGTQPTEPLPIVTKELFPTIEDCNSSLGHDAPGLDVETQPTEPLPLVTKELSNLGHDAPGLDVETQPTPQKSYPIQEEVKSPLASTQSSSTSNLYGSQSTSKSGDTSSPPLLP
jgi:5'-3' exonuclease